MIELKGLRTKISAFFASLPAILIGSASQVEPQLVIDVVSQHPVGLFCYQAVTYLATHHYRDQATVEPKLDDEQIVQKAEKDLERVLKPVDELELEMADDIGGDYEYVETEKV